MNIIMKLGLLFSICFFSAMPSVARSEKNKGDDRFWVEVVVNKGEEMVIGDSAVVTFVVHSALPIAKIESKPLESIKGGTMRKVGFDRDATTRRYVYHGHIINTLVWAQIVVRPAKTGKVTIPECSYSAELYSTRYRGWLGNDIYGEKIKVKAKSRKAIIVVKEKPTRTTAEMSNSGTIL